MSEEIKPCKICGSTEIKTTDYSYSAFNVGTTTCSGCGVSYKHNNLGCYVSQETFINLWNKSQKPTDKEIIKSLQSENKRLREELEDGFTLHAIRNAIQPIVNYMSIADDDEMFERLTVDEMRQILVDAFKAVNTICKRNVFDLSKHNKT